MFAFIESSQIFRVFGKRRLHGVVDHIRNGPVQRRGFKPQSAMDFGLEVNRGSFLGFHTSSLASKRFSGKQAVIHAKVDPEAVISFRTDALKKRDG